MDKNSILREMRKEYYPIYTLNWDYLMWRQHSESCCDNCGLVESQVDWNQTLVTRLSQSNATIIQLGQMHGASEVRLHSRLLPIMESLEYYKKGEDGNRKISKYDIVLDDEGGPNTIYVYRDDFFDLKNMVRAYHYRQSNHSGEPESVENFSPEVVEVYRRGLVVKIEIKNYDDTAMMNLIKLNTADRWSNLGFLEGLGGPVKQNIASLFECEASSLLNEPTDESKSDESSE